MIESILSFVLGLIWLALIGIMAVRMAQGFRRSRVRTRYTTALMIVYIIGIGIVLSNLFMQMLVSFHILPSDTAQSMLRRTLGIIAPPMMSIIGVLAFLDWRARK